MRTDIRYVSNHLDKSILFGGDSEDLHYFAHDLRNNTWKYNLGVAKTRVSSFDREPLEMSFPVGIAASSDEEGLRLRNEIQEIGERDIRDKTPGRLYVGDFYLECYIVGVAWDKYWFTDRIAEVTLTILSERPEWIRETMYSFHPQQRSDKSEHGANFEYNFEHNFMGSFPEKEIHNDSIFEADFIWRVYGQISNPYIRINNNLYQVNVTVPEGAQLVVNSRDKSVKLISSTGLVTDAFAERVTGTAGSGSYIFQKIPSEVSSVSWDNTYSFDLCLMETRSLPPFEGDAPWT